MSMTSQGVTSQRACVVAVHSPLPQRAAAAAQPHAADRGQQRRHAASAMYALRTAVVM
jgi:hypothetical protein